MSAVVLRADARCLPLPAASVDLVLCSPPFWQLRSYTDGGVHYDGQLGSEPTPQEYIDSLLECTREWVRVLKPTGSLFVELGDKYNSSGGTLSRGAMRGLSEHWTARTEMRAPVSPAAPPKCLLDLPARYSIRCVDELGLIKRANIVWHHTNGLPESVTDRVRAAHSMVFHFTKQPRYFAAVDSIREPQSENTHTRRKDGADSPKNRDGLTNGIRRGYFPESTSNPLGKLPGSVWEIPSAPLSLPECRLVWDGRTVRWFMTWAEGRKYMRRLARDAWAWRQHRGRPSLRPEADHFAAYPPELCRRIILGWSPSGICTACGEGRRPLSELAYQRNMGGGTDITPGDKGYDAAQGNNYVTRRLGRVSASATITGYACACPQPDAPTRPAVVADPFGGTGTTALVASVHGRHGVSFDLSADYCRLARWRTTDPAERARALGVPKPPPVPDGQEALFQ